MYDNIVQDAIDYAADVIEFANDSNDWNVLMSLFYEVSNCEDMLEQAAIELYKAIKAINAAIDRVENAQ